MPNGVWPVMLSPFKKDGALDYEGLNDLINWYIDAGVSGLFAVCQSSEMFELSLKERVSLANNTIEFVNGRVPVIASGHVSFFIEEQIEELLAMCETSIDSLVLITNRLAKQDDSDAVWINNMEKLLKALPSNIKLGLYECPYPYKRVLSKDCVKACVDSNRFTFLKDTSCSMKSISEKLEVMQGSGMKLFNANTATLLESLKIGASGYSGVMANYHPELYVYLCENFKKHLEFSEVLQSMLSATSLIELLSYPTNAKYYLKEEEKINIEQLTRRRISDKISDTEALQLHQLKILTDDFKNRILSYSKN
ncbi:MAG: dihydrodipicolinate synthase family protein [Christensenellaceae bacterium]|nr:dihydrodipicolinate synthase family protein [Christensenellaceae bacterium]